MKQKLTPGGTLDILTATEMAQIMTDALAFASVDEYERKRGGIVINAAGNGQTQASDGLTASLQYDWLMERISIGGGVGAANAIISIYENTMQDSDLLEVVGLGAAGKYSDSFSNNLWIPAGSQVIIGVTGAPANGFVTYNFQVKLKHRPRRVAA